MEYLCGGVFDSINIKYANSSGSITDEIFFMFHNIQGDNFNRTNRLDILGYFLKFYKV